MTLYELINNTTIQGNVFIQPFDADGRELDGFSVKNTEDLAAACGGKDWIDEWDDWKVNYIYANIAGIIVIEIQEEE